MESSSQNESAEPKNEGSSTDDQRQKSILSFFKPLARKEKPKSSITEIDKPRLKQTKKVASDKVEISCSESNVKKTKKKKGRRKEKDKGEPYDDIIEHGFEVEARDNEQKIETVPDSKEQEHGKDCTNSQKNEEEKGMKKKKKNKRVPDAEEDLCVKKFESKNAEKRGLDSSTEIDADSDAVENKRIKKKKKKEKERKEKHCVEESIGGNCDAIRSEYKAASSAKEDGDVVKGHLSEVMKESADSKGIKIDSKNIDPVIADITDKTAENVSERKEEDSSDFEVSVAKVKRKKMKKRVKSGLDSDEDFMECSDEKKLEKNSSKNVSNVGEEDEFMTKKATKKKSKKKRKNPLESDEDTLNYDGVKQICETKGDKNVTDDIEEKASNDVHIDAESKELIAEKVARKELKKIRKKDLASDEEMLILEEEKLIHEEKWYKTATGDFEKKASNNVHIDNGSEEFIAKKVSRKKLKKKRKKDLESEEKLLLVDEEKLIHGKHGDIVFASDNDEGEILRRKSKRREKKKEHRFDSDDENACSFDDDQGGRKKSDGEIEISSHKVALIEDLDEMGTEILLEQTPRSKINENKEGKHLDDDEISDDIENTCLAREKKAGALDGKTDSKSDRKKTLERKEKKKSKKIAKQEESGNVADEALTEDKSTRRSTRNRRKDVKYDFDEELFDNESEVRKPKRSKVMKFEDDDSDFESNEDLKARMKVNRKRKENDDGRKRDKNKQGTEKGEVCDIAEKEKRTKQSAQSPSKGRKGTVAQIGKEETDKTVQKFLGSQPSKSNFLSNFSKHLVEKQDELILLEVETALPVVSHVLQQSESEIIWYKNLHVAVRVRKFSIIKEQIDCMVPTSNANLKALINLDLDKKRSLLPKNLSSRNLDHCIQKIIQRTSKFPIVDTLHMYLECQMKILKQCVEKAELPKSNIKSIWEKQEKIVRIEILSQQKHLPEKILPPPNPKADIRNLFGKAKAKKKVESITTEEESERKGGSFKEPPAICDSKSSHREKDGCEDSKRSKEGKKRNKDKKSKKKKAAQRKEELKSTDHDSSIEVITKDSEKVDCKKAGTIEDSFTKVSKRARKVGREIVAQEEFVFSNDDDDKLAFEDGTKKRRSKKRARKLDESLDDAEKVGGDANKMESGKESNRKRTKGKGRSESDKEDATVEIFDDEIQDDRMKKKRGRPKKKSNKKTKRTTAQEQMDTGVQIEGEVVTDVEAGTQTEAGIEKEAVNEKETEQVQDDSSGKKKRKKRRSKNKKDDGACEAGTEEESIEKPEKKPQVQSFDIRTLFGKSGSKRNKGGFEAEMIDRASSDDKIETGKGNDETARAELIEIRGNLESSVKSKGVEGNKDVENDMEIVEEESQKEHDIITTGTKEEMIAEEKPKGHDIRTMFRRSFEKAAKANDSERDNVCVDVAEVSDGGTKMTDSSVVISSQESVTEIVQSEGSKHIEEDPSRGAIKNAGNEPEGAVKDEGMETTDNSVVISSQESVTEIVQSEGPKHIEKDPSRGATESAGNEPKEAVKDEEMETTDNSVVISSQESTSETERKQSKGSKASSEDRAEDITEGIENRKDIPRRLKDKKKGKRSRSRTSDIKATSSSSADDVVTCEKEGTPSELKENRKAHLGENEVIEGSITTVEESPKVVSRTSSILSFFKPTKGRFKDEETVEIEKAEEKPEKSGKSSDNQDSARVKSESSSSVVDKSMHVMVPDDRDSENQGQGNRVKDNSIEHDIDAEQNQLLKTSSTDGESLKLRSKRKRSSTSSIESIIDGKTPIVVCKDILIECPALSFPGTENKRVKIEGEEMEKQCEKQGSCATQKIRNSSATQKDILDLVDCPSVTERSNLDKDSSKADSSIADSSKAAENDGKTIGKGKKDLLNFFQPSHATSRVKNEKPVRQGVATDSSKDAGNLETSKHTEDVNKGVVFDETKIVEDGEKIDLEDENERLGDLKILLEDISKSKEDYAEYEVKGLVDSNDCEGNKEMSNDGKLYGNKDLEVVVENIITVDINDLNNKKGNYDITSEHRSEKVHSTEVKDVENEYPMKTIRQKRKRVPSVALGTKTEGEDEGRRRSSRVRGKEEQRREEEKKLQEELEIRKAECEKCALTEVVEDGSCESKSPEFKRRRKRKKISENSDIEETDDMNCSVEVIEDTVVAGEPDSGKGKEKGDSGVSEDLVLPDCERTTGGSSEIDKNSREEKKSKIAVEYQPITEEFVNSTLLWTEKYAPIKHDHVIGNKHEVERVFDWLSSWKEKHESFVMKMKLIASKRSRGRDDDDSEFDDSSDEDDSLSNTFVIVGNTGCGSTSTVYACAQELGYKVLEMNPSNCRSGKQIQSLLGEATQSHQVKRKFHGATPEDAAKNEEAAKGSKSLMSLFAGNKAKESEEGTAGNAKDGLGDTCEGETAEKGTNKSPVGGDMSLILFEQADIVFDEQDKGFWVGLNDLRKQAKRPIIITANESSVAAKLEGGAFEMTKMNVVRQELITNHLQALCLAEQVFPSAELLAKVVNYCKGNIRQSILQLQFTLEQWKDPSYKLMKPKLECPKIEETDADGKNKGQLAMQDVDKVQEDKTDDVNVVEVMPMQVVVVDKSEETDSIQAYEEQTDVTTEEGKICVKEDVSVERESKIVADKDTCLKSKDEEVSESNRAEVNVVGSSIVDSLPDLVADPALENKRKQETVLHITVLEDEECGIFEEERLCIIDKEKVDVTRLILNCNTDLYTPIKTRKSNKLEKAKDVSSGLEEIAAIAEQISKINTSDDPTRNFTDEKSNRYGWWGARLMDGIIDEECLYPSDERSSMLHEWYTNTSEAYGFLKESVIADETRDIETSSVPLNRKSDIPAVYSSLEDCLPLSARLDHRSLCADMIPAFSIICKSEENRKLNEYGRRSRRFLHYLDGINLHVEPELRSQLIENSIK